MKKNYLKFLPALLVALIISCTNEDPKSASAILTSTTWRAQGIYANNTQVPGTAIPEIDLKFSNGLININGTTVPAIWTLNQTGTEMTIIYPGGFGGGNLTVGSQTLKTRVSEGSLVFEAGTQNLSFLGGLITLAANTELRMIPQGTDPDIPNPLSNSTLTTGTWTGNKAGTEAGLWTLNSMMQTPVNVSFKFRTIFGINALTISGIPTPCTWTLNAASTQLTINYPKTDGTFSSVTWDIFSLAADKLVFRSATEASIISIITINSTNELRLVQQ